MRTVRQPLLAFALLTTPLLAQDAPPAGTFRGEVEVSEVLLDVLVTDRQENVILGLKPEDFEISEDGRPMEVVSATFYSHRVAERGVPAEIAPSEGGPAARYFLLVFQDLKEQSLEVRGLLQQQLRAGKDAAEFLRTSLTPTDWVAVFAYDKRLHLVTDFTRDRERLASAVERATTGVTSGENWPSRQGDDDGAPSLARSLPSGKALGDASKSIYDALTTIADAVDATVGRKNLLLYGTGFGRVDRFGQYEPERRDYDPMTRALNDANVAVYSIDLSPPGSEHSLAGSLTDISQETGGRYFRDVLQFAMPMREIAKETSGYYLVSYRSTHPVEKPGYQEVRVRLRNPELKVTARKGYRFGG